MKATLIRLLDKCLVAPLVFIFSLPYRAAAVRPATRGDAGDGDGARHWVAIKLVGMGDAVLMLPALAALRRRSEDTLVVITTPRCQQIFAAPGIADQVVVLGGRHPARQLLAALRALRRCTAVLDFEQHVYWSTALVLGTRLQARRFGFRSSSRMRHRAYGTIVEPGPEPRPMKEIFDDLARAAGRQPAPGLLPLPLSPDAAASVDAWITAQGWVAGRFLAVAPGSGATVSFRRLPAERWAEILRALPPELPIVLAGSALDHPLLAEIAQRAARPVTLQVNLNLQQLAHLFARAWKVVATDSGPMHLAAATGAEVIGIFGPDTPRRYAPYNPRSRAISLNLPCSPCNNCWIYREARCTNPDRFACIQTMPAELVIEAILAGSKPARGAGAGAGGAPPLP